MFCSVNYRNVIQIYHPHVGVAGGDSTGGGGCGGGGGKLEWRRASGSVNSVGGRRVP